MREIERDSLFTFSHFLFISSLSNSILLGISFIKSCHILSQNVRYVTFVADVAKKKHKRYEKIMLGRIRCEKVVPACTVTNNDTQ